MHPKPFQLSAVHYYKGGTGVCYSSRNVLSERPSFDKAPGLYKERPSSLRPITQPFLSCHFSQSTV